MGMGAGTLWTSAAIVVTIAACKTPATTAESATAPAGSGSGDRGSGASAGVISVPVLPAHSGSAKPRGSADVNVAIAGGDAGVEDAPKETPTSIGLPAVDFGTAGPLVIKGYPKPLETGMKDYVTAIAWAKDGSRVVACGKMAPMPPAKGAPDLDNCYARGASGPLEHASLDRNEKSDEEATLVGPKMGEMFRVLREGERKDPKVVQAKLELHPPPLNATWDFAKDVTVFVESMDRGGTDGGNVLRVGGSVGGEPPVFPIVVDVKQITGGLPFGGQWNAIVESPDKKELAFIGHFFCMEWCNEVAIARLTHGKLASLVFNDTAFRAHQKKDYAKSRDGFLRATWADPRAPLPPYNLACAYALLRDEANATKALKLAIAVGGEKVKAKAKKDADFKSVASAAWFTDLTK